MGAMQDHTRDEVNNERRQILGQWEQWLETPLILLGLLWLVLLVIELRWGLSPFLETTGTLIWVIFILDFAVRLIISPDKLQYLKQNWLTAVALVLPALRVLRIARLAPLLRTARAARSLRLLRIVTSLNRGMKALSASFGRRGFGYVSALTGLVLFAGAGGMYAFENEVPGGLNSYGVALWWTAMLLTSIGSDYWPQTAEGRVLCFLLSLYGFGVFGYVTAA
ncbi:MAG TPA: ion transporter, partial [Pyrinomonadaceae bacterium]|nr:ion transporter [Pyrinomonadaceae bacterium]